MVLHTWARDLRRHYHVHCIVTGGGLAQDGEHWISAGVTFRTKNGKPVTLDAKEFLIHFMTTTVCNSAGPELGSL